MSYSIPQIVKDVQAGTAQLFDVREQDEWDAGHLKLAQLVPLSELHAGIKLTRYDKSLPTYIHCRSGVRVQSAAPLLQMYGFTNVIALAEGFITLANSGVETE